MRLNLPAKSSSRRATTLPSTPPSCGGRRGEDRVREARHVHNEDAEERKAAQHVQHLDALRRGQGLVAPRRRVRVDVVHGSDGIKPRRAPNHALHRKATKHVRDDHRGQPAQAVLARRDRTSCGPRGGRGRGTGAGQARRDAALAQGAGGRGPRHRHRRRAVAPALRARLPRVRRGHRLRAQGEDGHPRQPLRRDGAAGGGPAAAEGPRAPTEAQIARAHTRQASSSSPCRAR